MIGCSIGKARTEAEVTKEIREYFEAYGWLFIRHQQNTSHPAVKGMADFTIMNRGIQIWLEVKSPTGKQSAAQKEFQELVESRQCLYCLARGVQDVLDFISEKLKRIW